MAEFIGGTEEGFVDLMNQTATILGMKDTHFSDSHGLPIENHFSSSRDLATLSRAWIYNYPEYYPWFKVKWIMYNGIKQPNRNRLLWRDSSVDGIKTGHTKDAGYCLAASAERSNMRLIAIVLGAASDNARANYTEALLNYGFRFYESHKIYSAKTTLAESKVKFGKTRTIPLGLMDDLSVTIPTGQYKNLKIRLKINDGLHAPILEGQACGNLILTLNDKTVYERPIVALKNDPVGGLFHRLFEKIYNLF
jgi:D-alanyl-D-alanine carboxypeptidase (penicillin-binding protein 5/6)